MHHDFSISLRFLILDNNGFYQDIRKMLATYILEVHMIHIKLVKQPNPLIQNKAKYKMHSI